MPKLTLTQRENWTVILLFIALLIKVFKYITHKLRFEEIGKMLSTSLLVIERTAWVAEQEWSLT